MIQDLQNALAGVFPVLHVRQEHEGTRKQKIVNEAVRRSTGDYLFFTDGDCMVHRHCLREHVRRSERRTILAGQRVQIGEQMTEKLLAEGRVVTSLTGELFMDFLAHKSHHAQEAIIIRSSLLRWLFRKEVIKPHTSVIGCHCSLYKDLFVAVNGYDEDFQSFGEEDADLGVRILNYGGTIRSVRNLAVVYHLDHPKTWDIGSSQFQFNASIKHRRIKDREPVCKNGIYKL